MVLTSRAVGLLLIALTFVGLFMFGLWRPGASGYSEGEVQKLDRRNKQVWLHHQEISGLGLPATTTLFDVADERVLDKVQPAEQVIFKARAEGGKFVVVEIHRKQ